MKTTYQVNGMTCGGCAGAVTRAVGALAPDVEVEVDLQSRTITVAGIDDDEAIGRVVREAGFEFSGKVNP